MVIDIKDNTLFTITDTGVWIRGLFLTLEELRMIEDEICFNNKFETKRKNKRKK